MVIRLPGQGFMPSPPLELLAELVILGHVQVNIPLWEDVSGMHVLLITFLGDLGHKSRRVIWLLRSRGGCFSLSGGHMYQKNHREEN